MAKRDASLVVGVTNDDDLEIVRFGALVPPTLDDDDWAASFARAQGIESVAAD